MDLQACTEGDSSRGGLGGARRAYSGTEALSAEALLHLCCTLSFVLWRCGAALPLVGGGAAECLSRTVALLHCLSQIGLSYLTLAVARAQGVGQAQGCVEGRASTWRSWFAERTTDRAPNRLGGCCHAFHNPECIVHTTDTYQAQGDGVLFTGGY